MERGPGLTLLVDEVKSVQVGRLVESREGVEGICGERIDDGVEGFRVAQGSLDGIQEVFWRPAFAD